MHRKSNVGREECAEYDAERFAARDYAETVYCCNGEHECGALEINREGCQDAED
jgi:hypothetical protein